MARADELHLKNGRVVEVEEVWEVGEAVWYRQGKIIASFAKTEILKITRSKSAPALNPAAPSGSTSLAMDAPKSASVSAPLSRESGEDVVSRKIAQVILKDGARIDADAVWEDTERIGYRLGKMQTFIDRSEVQRVIHDVTVNERKGAPQYPGLRYTTGNQGLDQLIAYSGDKYGIDPTLIYLVMYEESRFNHRAVSRVGARGLMQLMPGTAAKLGVRNIHDPIENVDAGARYLRTLLEMFNGDVNLALAAYNAGEGAVLKYGRRIPPYRETRNYVWRINTAYRRAMVADRNEN